MKSRPVRCEWCKKSFKSRQGLAGHKPFCRAGPRVLTPVQREKVPADESIPRAAPTWDVNWPEARKRATLLSELPVDWGIRRQGGRWVPVIMVDSQMSYSQAVIAADRFNVLDRISPPHPRHPPIEQQGEDEDLVVLLLLLMLTM